MHSYLVREKVKPCPYSHLILYGIIYAMGLSCTKLGVCDVSYTWASVCFIEHGTIPFSISGSACWKTWMDLALHLNCGLFKS